MNEEETAVAVIGVHNKLALEPQSIREAVKMAEFLYESGTLPSSIRNAPAAFAIIKMGQELGFSTMQSFRFLHIIEDREGRRSAPVLTAQGMMAMVMKSGLAKFFSMVESTNEHATYQTLRIGDPSPTSMTWTLKQAEEAWLLRKKNWQKFPAEMLRARCVTALCRERYPDVCGGLYTRDEIEDAEPSESSARKSKKKPKAGEVIEASLVPEPDQAHKDMVANLERRLRAAQREIDPKTYAHLAKDASRSLGDLKSAVKNCEDLIETGRKSREVKKDSTGESLARDPAEPTQESRNSPSEEASDDETSQEPRLWAAIETLRFRGVPMNVFQRGGDWPEKESDMEVPFHALTKLEQRDDLEGIVEAVVVDNQWVITSPTPEQTLEALEDRRAGYREALGLHPQPQRTDDYEVLKVVFAEYVGSMEKGMVVGRQKAIVALQPETEAETCKWLDGKTIVVLDGEIALTGGCKDMLSIQTRLEKIKAALSQ